MIVFVNFGLIDLRQTVAHALSMTRNPKVAIQPVLPEHRDGLFAQYSHPDSVHMAAFVFGDPCDRKAFEERMDRLLSNESVTYRTVFADGRIVGAVAAFDMEGEREITYGIHPDFWDRGIATEALRLFLEEETLRPLYARAASDNRGSLRVLEKCGFVKTGTETSFAPARGETIEETICVLT